MEKKMKFDDVYDIIGGMGVYQICVFLVCCLLPLLAVETIYMNFVAYNPGHWCKISSLSTLPHELQVGFMWTVSVMNEHDDGK